MSWFANYFFKEGRGISKDEPIKVGLPLFLSIIKREWLDLIKLNLLFLLLTLPIITIPAAYLASIKISISFIQDKNVYLSKEYFRCLKEQFIRASVYSLLFFLLIALGVMTTRFYIYNMTTHYSFVALATISASITLFIIMVASCFFTVLAMNKINDTATLLKVSIMAVLLRPKAPILGLLTLIILWLIHFIFYPISIFMPILFNFSIGTLILTFSTLKGVNEALALFKKN